jgi:hypothetical protein
MFNEVKKTLKQTTLCFVWCNKPNWAYDALIFRFLGHTQTHARTHTHTHTHTRQDSSKRVISWSHRPLHTQDTLRVCASSLYRNHDPSNRTAADLSLRQHDHPDRRTRQHAMKIFKATNKYRKFDWQNGHNCCVTSGSDGVYQCWFTHRKPLVQIPNP